MVMFTPNQKRDIATRLQDILRATDDPYLPNRPNEIKFWLLVIGERGQFAEVRNNGAIKQPTNRSSANEETWSPSAGKVEQQFISSEAREGQTQG